MGRLVVIARVKKRVISYWIFALFALVFAVSYKLLSSNEYRDSLYFSAFGSVYMIIFYIFIGFSIVYFIYLWIHRDAYLYIVDNEIKMQLSKRISIVGGLDFNVDYSSILPSIVISNNNGDFIRNKLYFIEENIDQIKENYEKFVDEAGITVTGATTP